MRPLLHALLIASTPLLPAAALAQNGAPIADAAPITSSAEFANHELLYSLVPSTFLSDSVASAYGITRAADRTLVNVSLRRKLADGTDVEQSAQVSGSYSDLIQKKPLEFREVREQGAIYYIAEFRHGDRETLRFDIGVTTADGAAKNVSFTRTLYIDK